MKKQKAEKKLDKRLECNVIQNSFPLSLRLSNNKILIILTTNAPAKFLVRLTANPNPPKFN